MKNKIRYKKVLFRIPNSMWIIGKTNNKFREYDYFLELTRFT